MYASVILSLLYIMLVVGYPVSDFLMLEILHPADDLRLTKDVMIMEDIQTHYKNLVDEVISSHSEDFLLSMTWSMSKEKMNTVYRPEISMLLVNRPSIQYKCLHRVPHWIGKYLHDMHSKAYETVDPKIQDHMDAHWPSSRWYPSDMITTNDITEFLSSLNQKLLPIISLQLNPNLALVHIAHQLQACQSQQENHRWSFGFTLFDHSARLPSSFDINGTMKHHFLVRFLTNMQADVATQMRDRMADLIPLIQDDLQDRFVD